jgi:hypothetical protein
MLQVVYGDMWSLVRSDMAHSSGLLAVVETNSGRSRLVDADTTADVQQTAVKDNVIATSV